MVLRQLIFVCIRSKRACNLCGACAFHILATGTVPLNCTMHSVCRSTWTALHCGIGLIFHLRMPHNTIIHKIWLANSASWSYHTHNATKLLGQMSSLFRQVQTALWKAWLIFFPKDVSSQGSSEDCWCISHHTYPTHIHSKRIPPIRIPPIRIRSTRSPTVRIHSMRIHSKGLHQQILHTYPFKTYATNTYPTNTYPFNTYPTKTYPCDAYPFNAYPFKRCASAGIANVSHQYISHQYVSVQHVSHQYGSIQCVSIQKFASAGMAMSMSIIACHFIHCYSAGMVMKMETLLFLQFLCNFINWI